MSRSKWKGPFVYPAFFQTFKYTSDKYSILPKKIKERGSTINSIFVGKQISLHDGKIFKKLHINREKVGFKFGNFLITKKFTFKAIEKKKAGNKKKKK